MGAHVFGPAYLRDVLLPSGRILGWSNDWFAGFPAFYFYFPLPSLVIVLLDVVLPYGVAFKLVTVAGLLALAPSMYFLARSMGFARQVATVVAAGGAVFAFMESYSIYGGNVASTLAGEFSYSWSFALGLVYLGFLIRAVEGEEGAVPKAAIAFGLTALSHVLTTLVLVFASLTVLLWKGASKTAIRIWVWAFAIAAFWALPLMARIGLTSDMAWTPLSRWEEVFPIEVWLTLPLAVIGAAWAVRRTHTALPMVAATLLPLVYYPLPNLLPDMLPDLFDDGRFKLWNGRLLPYWYFGIVFFATLAVGAFVMWASRRLPERVSTWWGRGFGLLVGVVAAVVVAGLPLAPDSGVAPPNVPGWVPWLIVGAALIVAGLSLTAPPTVSSRALLSGIAATAVGLGALAGVTFVDGWARWNYTGYEGKGPWPEYEALMETVDGLPRGRIQWEANSDLDRYGTPMALMLFPYWTETHQSMEGLFFESSLTTPFHFLNAGAMSASPSNPIPGLPYHTFDFAYGLDRLELYGVDYYVAFTEEAIERADEDPSLVRVTESDPWVIYRLPETSLVEVASHQPSVFDPNGADAPTFDDLALDWYDEDTALDRLVTADGPGSWPRVASVEELPDVVLQPGGTVSDIEVDDHRISFRTDAIGVPHLVKVSYFPNWTAEGADGPYRSTPSLMVVVPTSEEVVLEFRPTWAENGGFLLTLGGLVALVAVPVRRRLGQRASDAEQPA